MTTHIEPPPAEHPTPPGFAPTNCSPVTVHHLDTVGAIFLGIMSIMLLGALMRSENRNRALVSELAAAKALAPAGAR